MAAVETPKRTANGTEGGGPPRGRRTTILAAAGALVAVLLIGSAAILLATGHAKDGSAVGGPFALTDGNGKTVTDADFRGKYLLVYFGYTFCPDVCPTTLTAVADAIDRLGPDGKRLQPVFITVDPARDTPAAVKQYVASFGPEFVGLSGSADQIAKVAREFRVYYAPHRTGPGPNDYTMDHSSILYLMGPDGTFVAPLRADGTGADLAAALKKAMS
ncbi:MAG: SCO family protein [Proteobacteria bacterium]|nr:SCO family protein [Pseudomonadota bacterium]